MTKITFPPKEQGTADTEAAPATEAPMILHPPRKRLMPLVGAGLALVKTHVGGTLRS